MVASCKLTPSRSCFAGCYLHIFYVLYLVTLEHTHLSATVCKENIWTEISPPLQKQSKHLMYSSMNSLAEKNKN